MTGPAQTMSTTAPPLDPLLAPLVRAFNASPPAELGVADADGSPYAAYIEPGPELADVHDELIMVTQPAGQVRVRVYAAEPSGTGAATGRGALVYLHGGGWRGGSLEELDAHMRNLAAETGAVVISVDYRLAPAHPFPVAVHDSYDALRWAHAQAGRLGFDPARLGVGGDSAGANLAAAVAQLAASAGPVLALQVLECPALDLTCRSSSVELFADGYVLTKAELHRCVDGYLDGHDASEPLASPLLAESVGRVAPAVIMAAELDPVGGDARRYATRLAEAGVPVVHREAAGLIHGSHRLTGLLPAAREWRAAVNDAVRDRLGSLTPPPASAPR
jgi:acetyl esterase